MSSWKTRADGWRLPRRHLWMRQVMPTCVSWRRANGILFGKPEKRLVLFHARGGKRASAPPHRSAEGPLSTGKRFYRLSGSEVSAYVEDMHDMIHAHASGQEGAAPFLIPALPLMRMTARLCGLETLRRADLGCWRTMPSP